MSTITDIGTLITQTPGVCGGRPCIAGTRVTVRRIVGEYRAGYMPEEIQNQLPHLSMAQILAALTYYHANRAAMDAAIAADEAEEKRLEREFLASRQKN